MEVSALKYSGGIGLHGRSPLLRLQSDERLVALTRRGNASAFEVLVARYEVRLLAFCRHLLSSREDGEDVLQDVFASAYNAMLADERPINVRPWLYRIARNRCLNHLRKASAIGVDSMDIHFCDHGASTADKVGDREQFRELLGDIQSLPESQRTALVLREMDALSYEQIAEAMETTIPSVKSLLVRARVSLGEASEARLLNCEDVRAELGEVAEGLIRKPGALARRHLKSCERCAAFQTHLQTNNKALAALLPVAPVAWLSKLWLAAHLGHSAGSAAGGAAGGSAAAGAGAAGAGAAGAAGAAAGSGASSMISAGVGALATKAAAGIAVAAVATASAVAVEHHSKPHITTNPAVATAVHAGVTMAGASGTAIAQPINSFHAPGPKASAALSAGHRLQAHATLQPQAHAAAVKPTSEHQTSRAPAIQVSKGSKSAMATAASAPPTAAATPTSGPTTVPTPPAPGRRVTTTVPTVLPTATTPAATVAAPPTSTVAVTPTPVPSSTGGAATPIVVTPAPSTTSTQPTTTTYPGATPVTGTTLAPTTTSPVVTTPTTSSATPAPPVVVPAPPVDTSTSPVTTSPVTTTTTTPVTTTTPTAPPSGTTTSPVATTPTAPPTGTTAQTSTTPPADTTAAPSDTTPAAPDPTTSTGDR